MTTANTISDEQMYAKLATLQQYTMVILTDGPRPDHPDHDALIWEHGRRNMLLMEENVMPIVCPVRDDSTIHGFCLIVGGREDAEAIMKADPAVQAGIFAYSVHACVGFPGSSLP